MQTVPRHIENQARGCAVEVVTVVEKGSDEDKALHNMVKFGRIVDELKKSIYTDPDKYKTGICDSEFENLISMLKNYSERCRFASKVSQIPSQIDA